ncbi:MAG: hypothetical protein GY868_00675, partial [Deltaproteobacteria bacterium]|nr:hypothetical protein [Deltaproteobacteria bacterium]
MLTCLLASLLLLCSCSLERGAVNEWGEVPQRELAGLFTGQWYDYYLRGLTRAQLNSWEEAAADFREAVAGRDRDQRRARTYGMHFIDYFPHRELGIAWYRIGRYEEAQTELERSLAQIETSKAKYYLNKTRRALLQAAGNDSQPPAISLDSLPEGLVTNRHRMTIVGTASDAGYSGSVSVNNLPQFVELAEQVLAFSEEVMIKPGPNNITVTAADLMGNVAEKKITVKGDFSGPLIAFDNVAGGDQVSAERFVLRGELADAGGLAALQVNGRQTCYNRTSQAAFAVELELIKGINPISVLATDVVGNTTAVTLELAYSPATALASPVMLAAATDSILDTGQSMFFARAHGALPRIELRGIQDQQVTCFDEFLFEGSVRSGEGVHDIRINGSSIMSAAGSTGIAGTLKDLAVGLRKSVAFSRIVPLQEGRNTIRIVAVDGRDRTVTKNITVTKKTPRVKQLGSRLSLSVFPFTESDPERKL